MSLGECQYVPTVGYLVQNISAEVEANSVHRAEKVRGLRSQAEFQLECVCLSNTDRLIIEDNHLIAGISTDSEDQRLKHEKDDPLFDSSFYELYLLHLTIGYMKRTSSSY